MTYVLAHYWLPALLSLIVGGITGYVTFVRGHKGWWPSSFPVWFKALCVAFLAGLAVDGLSWAQNGPGLWLDTALVFLGAWIIGCFVGAFVASLTAAPVEEIIVAPAPAPVYAPEATPAPIPQPAAIIEEPVLKAVELPDPGNPEGAYPGLRPVRFDAKPQDADDLKRILGVGPVNEKKLHELGIFTFRQIADWTPENVEWVGGYLSFGDRIIREDWIGQCKLLAEGLETEHSKKVDRGEI